jgi:hypothetical protein
VDIWVVICRRSTIRGDPRNLLTLLDWVERISIAEPLTVLAAAWRNEANLADGFGTFTFKNPPLRFRFVSASALVRRVSATRGTGSFFHEVCGGVVHRG